MPDPFWRMLRYAALTLVSPARVARAAVDELSLPGDVQQRLDVMLQRARAVRWGVAEALLHATAITAAGFVAGGLAWWIFGPSNAGVLVVGVGGTIVLFGATAALRGLEIETLEGTRCRNASIDGSSKP
jgi:hypothetical protein